MITWLAALTDWACSPFVFARSQVIISFSKWAARPRRARSACVYVAFPSQETVPGTWPPFLQGEPQSRNCAYHLDLLKRLYEAEKVHVSVPREDLASG